MRSVSRSLELMRILEMPIRQVEDMESLATALTDTFKTPEGSMQLFPIQALALKEFYEAQGLFGALAVGSGKSLISYLAPVVMEAKCPLLLLPAKLIPKTKNELKRYGQHFKLHPDLRIMSYELLSRDRGQKEFLEMSPDLIIADECHRLKSTKAACTKRIKRYFRDKPETIIMALSGTMCRNSIMDYHHILQWCLKDNTPLPISWHETQSWSLALDEKIPFGHSRYLPGALLLFSKDEELKRIVKKELDQTEGARIAYKRRLLGTQGVLASSKGFYDSSLLIKSKIYKQPEVIKSAFKRLRELWQTPDGIDLMDGMAVWKLAKELSCGFYYSWENPAPKEWLEARKDWGTFVREVVKHNRKGIDTEFQVANAVVRGEYKSPEYATWLKIRESFKPITKPTWLDESLLEYATDWLHKNKKGVVWCDHVAFNLKLAEKSGFPYYGQKGMSKNGQHIEQASGPIIAGITANKEGNNIQANYDTNLIISTPSSGTDFEQLVGRTHRTGQPSDEVSVEILLGCYEDYKSVLDIIRESEYSRNTIRENEDIPKISYADKDLITEEDIKKLVLENDFCWKK